MLTHTLTTEYTALFAIIYLLLNIQKLKNKDVIKKIIVNVIFIITISMFFLAPLLEYRLYSEYTIFSADAMFYKGEDVAATTISLVQLFKDLEPDGVSFTLGITFTVLMLLGIFTYRKMDNQDKANCLSFLVIAMISLFMTTRFFPWTIMPDLVSTMQFAWRMLAFFEFAMAIFCGYNLFTAISMASNKKNEWMKELLVVASIVLIIITMSNINYNYKYEEQKKLPDKEYEEWIKSKEVLSVYSINREYLPYKKKINEYILSRDNNAHIISGYAEIQEQKKDKLIFNCNAENVLEGTVIELPFISYPGYTITLESDNQKQNIDYYESENGFIEIKILDNMKSVNINVEYTGTIVEKISYIISGISVILFIMYLLYIKRKEKLNDSKA